MPFLTLTDANILLNYTVNSELSRNCHFFITIVKVPSGHKGRFYMLICEHNQGHKRLYWAFLIVYLIGIDIFITCSRNIEIKGGLVFVFWKIDWVFNGCSRLLHDSYTSICVWLFWWHVYLPRLCCLKSVYDLMKLCTEYDYWIFPAISVLFCVCKWF